MFIPVLLLYSIKTIFFNKQFKFTKIIFSIWLAQTFIYLNSAKFLQK